MTHSLRPPATPLLTRAQIFLDYAHIISRLPELQAQISGTVAGPEAALAAELDELTRSIPKLIEILPDILRNRDDPRHNAALAEMISTLMTSLDRVKPLALVGFSDIPPCIVRLFCCSVSDPNQAGDGR